MNCDMEMHGCVFYRYAKPGQRDASRRSWVNVEPPSTTLAQHGVDGGLMHHICPGGGLFIILTRDN